MSQDPIEEHKIYIFLLQWIRNLVLHPVQYRHENSWSMKEISKMLIHITKQINSLTWGRKSSSVAILPYMGTSSMGCKKVNRRVIIHHMKTWAGEDMILKSQKKKKSVYITRQQLTRDTVIKQLRQHLQYSSNHKMMEQKTILLRLSHKFWSTFPRKFHHKAQTHIASNYR